jgi:2-isopropylmalate synthase
MRKSIFKKLEAQGLIANYNRLRKNLPPRLPERVYIWDYTLRETSHTPTVFLTYVEKVKFVKMLDEMGVSMITVGYPALSEEEKTTVKKITNESFQQASLVASSSINKNEVDACLECGLREIAVVAPFNGIHLQYRLKMTKEQVMDKTVETIGYAKKHGVKVDFVLEDGARTPIEDILQIFEIAVKAGADRLVVVDTVGFMRPLSMRYLMSHIREGLSTLKIREIPLSVHCHNDFGLATANALAAVEEGVTYLQTCAAGFGERAGGTPFEEVVAALELLYNIDTGIELDKLYRLSQLAEKTFALPIQFHKPIIGENAFSWEVDERVQAVLTQPLLYVPFPPEIVGRESVFYLGRYSGKQLIENWLAQVGIKASPMQVEDVAKRIKWIQDKQDKGETQMTFYQIKKLLRDLHKGLSEEEFWRIVEQVTRQKPKLPEKKTASPT